MRRLSQIQVGVPTFSAIFAAATVAWYSAMILGMSRGKAFMSELSDFWSLAYVGCPLLCALLAPIFVRVYVYGNRKHPWLFWSALTFGFSPFVLGGVLILLS